ncbi:unnamed protein product (macronuclear) [Paramecium tetraurelia]|uniref:Uncharacterized protein n=1 Tax=Paramecium tetraurelia TaxID=5888 RepID=A0CV16_PARTE|nr:uncharacterized protein GSPATT00010801001 [Paramecium tetraurelia]CAK74633.1 unnamed protein product [Paramecium tetraurelia]|eukprot:XP_001442030.1 hypothetical protein (macronuclear) [Paramecium tetraurelia strain d4-2]
MAQNWAPNSQVIIKEINYTTHGLNVQIELSNTCAYQCLSSNFTKSNQNLFRKNIGFSYNQTKGTLTSYVFWVKFQVIKIDVLGKINLFYSF